MKHGFPDPSLIDHPIGTTPADPVPSWPTIIAAAIGAGALIFMTWFGGLFNG